VGNEIPVPGQLVTVRQRHFVVTDVKGSPLPSEALYPVSGLPQYLVSLSSVEDDGEGEELNVIWEIEPGAAVHERAQLPEPSGFDHPHRLNVFLNAVRWGAISSADVRALQAPFRSGIEIEDYQLEPLVRSLQMPRVNLLIADDVGLGKTVETGLVMQELMIRRRVHSVLIVCPASIQIQWRNQMRDKFGLEFRVVDSDLMRDLRRRRGLHVNPWTHFPRLITSMDFIKRDRPFRLLRETLPAEGEPKFPRRFDLLVVDEAHNVAPAGAGQYATDSLRTVSIRSITSHFEHKLFLTATPHNGYPESFSALLELVDSQRFARGIRPDQKQLWAVMVRRMKDELPPRWDGSPRFPKREIEPLEVDYTVQERSAHLMLQEYTSLRTKNFTDETERFATEFVLKLLKKRLFSSPAAFAVTLDRHERTLTGSKRHFRDLGQLPVGILRRQLAGIEEDYADDEEYEQAASDSVDVASKVFRPLTADERALLAKLKDFAQGASVRADSKAKRLIQWLRDIVKPNGVWGDERVLIFTEYRATQKWLHDLLAAEGLAEGDRLLTLYGGMRQEDTERVKAAFQANPADAPVRILLATDCAAEGIDLQNHCSRVIHYEIPWNPNRMEQRNGRIDRHGQRSPCVWIYHFVGKGFEKQASKVTRNPGELDGDLEFLLRAVLKVETIREDIGKVGPVIARQVEEAMLGHRNALDTSSAEQEAKPIRQLLRLERQLRDQIDKLREQLDETKTKLRLSPENFQSAVEIGLELAGQPPLIETQLPGIWPDPLRRRKKCPVFHLPPLSGSWAVCAHGLEHPHTGKKRPIVFDHELAANRDDVVLAHLNHRLVQMSLALLRAEIWAHGENKNLHRVSALIASSSAIKDPVVISHARLVVLGGDNRRLHEEVIEAGGQLREGRFVRMNVGEVAAALASASTDEAPEWIKKRVSELWPHYSEALMRSLEARMRDRASGLEKLLSDRCEKEINDLTAILSELEKNIQKELKDFDQVPAQLELRFPGWTPSEREQLERNMASLRARLRKIPEEIRQETEGIRSRYANPSPRLFPVAVTFIVPEGLARQREGLS